MVHRKNILFSFDHSVEGQNLLGYLKERGFNPHIVEGGTADIIYQTSLKRPDLVILFDSPPEIESHEICKILKGQIETQSILLMVLDGETLKSQKLTAFGLAADTYISRFLPVEELYAKIYSLLSIRDLQLQLLESEKFAALGRVADRIAHEFRNPLTIIGGFAYRIKKKHPADPVCQDYISRIIKEVSRLERIIDQVADFEISSKEAYEFIDLVVLLQEIRKEFSAIKLLVPEGNVRIEVPENDQIPLIRANRQSLKSVFTNLIENALDAIPKGRKGLIRIETGMDIEEGILWINLKDNGTGIPPEELNKVMDPFYTTKPYRIGLGLTLVYQHIRDIGGRVDFESEEGKGTMVRITLPMILKAPIPIHVYEEV
jgi:signal transduction histidine kinase